MNIVLDTNILVSGLLQPVGPSGQIVRLVASGELALSTIQGSWPSTGKSCDARNSSSIPNAGNVKHYPAEARHGVEVLSPRSFIELYRIE